MSRRRHGGALSLVRAFCAGAVLLLPQRLDARALSFRRIGVKDGLSQSSVYCVLQDRRGFLWVGTQDGLNRYDGYGFKVYRSDASDPASLSNDAVTSLREDREGNLWVATLQGGLNRYDPRTDRFARFRHSNDPRSLASDKVYTVFVDGAGDVWAGTSGGLCRFDSRTESFRRYVHDPKDPATLSLDKSLAIAEDREGRLWVGTIGGGLNRLDRERRRFVRYAADPKSRDRLASDWITSLLVDSSGTVWAGTKGGGLSRYVPESDSFVTYRHDPKDPSSISNDMIWALAEAPLERGVLWIGTYGGGLCRHVAGSNAFERFRHDPHDPSSLGDDQVSAIRQDAGGVLWLGTWAGGLSYADLAAKEFVSYRSDRPGELSNDVVFALTEDRGGSLWVGTYGGGLCRGLGDGGGDRRFRCFRSVPSDPTTLSDDVVTNLLEDREGGLWVGTNGGGLNRFDGRKETFTRHRLGPKEAKNAGANVVLSMTEDSEGRLLVGTEEPGLIRFDPRTGTSELHHSLTGRPSAIDALTIVQLLWDRNGRLWIVSGEPDLYRWDPATRRLDRVELGPGVTRGKALVPFAARDGTIWIGTGDGLLRYDPSTGRTTGHGGEGKLPSGVMDAILEDAEGRLWIATNRGLTVFDPGRGTFRSYGENDGVANAEFNSRSAATSRSGELFFGGTQGVTAFVPSRIRDNSFAPPVAITAIRVGNEETKTATSVPWLDRFRMPYGAGVLSVDVAALAFARPERNRFAYRVDGVTREWIDVGTQHRIGLGRLGPGEYIVRVKAASPDGVWSEKEASLRVVVVPPFWRTWWFLTLAALAFAMASYSMIHLTRRYLSLVAFWKTRAYVGHYRILGTLGSGGMGVVYRAVDVMDRSRLLAVKVLREEYSDDPVFRRRFLNEAALIDQLDHPGIVKVIERGETDRRLFMAMELLSGETLAARIAAGRTIPLGTCLSLLRQLAGAVGKVHERGIVHRDLKPANVMLTGGIGEEGVKLLDFGLARAQTLTRLTETGMIVGSINYLAPEQISDRSATPASDVYALGVIFFETVTLEKPFLGETAVDVIKQILEKEPLPPSAFRPELPDRLDRLILAMLKKRPGERPTTTEVLDTLLLASDEREAVELPFAERGIPA